jgi:hypothetical protein
LCGLVIFELSAEDTKLLKELSEGIKSFDEAVKKSKARKKKEEEGGAEDITVDF